MKFCVKCSQYHNLNDHKAQNCYTYEKYTYLLKDEFLKWNKESIKMSKQSNQSYNNHQKYTKKKEVMRTYQSDPENSFEQNNFYVNKSKKPTLNPKGKLSSVNKRINDVINKTRAYKEYCDHLKSTSCDELQTSAVQRHLITLEQDFEQLIEFEDQFVKKIPPTQKKFEKPYNSKMKQNKTIYDSLKDYRFCGITICEEGQVEQTHEELLKILSKIKLKK